MVDQSYAIALQVSQALNQHGRNASVIPLLLLSAAAEVHETMNQRLAPEWECVKDNDTCMEKHPFFPKTKGYVTPVLVPVLTPTPVSVPPLAPEVMSVPPIDSLPTEAAKPKTNKGKGKQPDRGTRRPRENDIVGNEPRKKRKLVKSKPVITVSDDEDDQLEQDHSGKGMSVCGLKVSVCFQMLDAKGGRPEPIGYCGDT
ncbi:hypothetical protein P692DRAFT_20880083 [Suillus brevipes Sb2]|nr:hypothetical protein P692DRAFT_20880083 [Suillus brevipes Sb2]